VPKEPKEPKEPNVYVHYPEDGAVGFGTRTRDDVAGVTGRLEDVGGRLVLTEIKFLALNAERAEITSSTLRAVRMDTLLSSVRGQILNSQERASADASSETQLPAATAASVKAWRRQIARTAAAAVEQKARGRRGYGDAFYRQVALEYLELTRQGKGGRGVLAELSKIMAERMGEAAPRSRDNVRDWVAEARRRQFLTPGTPGRGGANPGPKLYEGLDEA
jgi:hypothetical protein